MKIFLSVLLLSVSIRSSWGLTCFGCDISNTSQHCSFSYECPEGTEYCEALVSKVNGNTSLILACATMEKCGMNSVSQGFEKCNHHKRHTECFSCCEDDKCNGLAATMKQLPDNLLVPESNTIDYDSEEYDNEEDEMRNEEEFLKELEQMIVEDEKKLEKGENITEKEWNRTTTTSIELATSEPVEITSKKSLAETTKIDQNLNSSIQAVNGTPATTMVPLEESTTGLMFNVTTATVNEISGLNETEPEVLLDEVLIDHSDDFSAKHHALTGSSSSSKFTPELSLFFVNLLVVLVIKFTT